MRLPSGLGIMMVQVSRLCTRSLLATIAKGNPSKTQRRNNGMFLTPANVTALLASTHSRKAISELTDGSF